MLYNALKAFKALKGSYQALKGSYKATPTATATATVTATATATAIATAASPVPLNCFLSLRGLGGNCGRKFGLVSL